MQAILPLQDTKPGASLIISGTAGEARTGIFWDYLERGRGSDKSIGIVDYAAPEDTDWEVIEDEHYTMELLKTCHPGIGTLTTIEKMIKNYRSMAKPQWAREYLSMWPETFGTTAVQPEQWDAARLQTKKQKPPRIAFGLAIKPGGSTSAIVAAWRDKQNIAHIEVVEHRQGTSWLPKRMQELTTKYRGSTIAYDDIGEGKATAVECAPLQPKVKLRMQTYRETSAGCIQFLRELDRGTVKHFDQVGLNEAVVRAGKREIRGDHGMWLWTTIQPGDDITCLDAATRALRNWDQHFAKTTNGAPADISFCCSRALRCRYRCWMSIAALSRRATAFLSAFQNKLATTSSAFCSISNASFSFADFAASLLISSPACLASLSAPWVSMPRTFTIIEGMKTKKPSIAKQAARRSNPPLQALKSCTMTAS